MSDATDEAEPDDLDYWRLCDELSIVEAALLTAGHSPGKLAGLVEGWQAHQRPSGYEAAKSAITNALRGGRIKGTIKPSFNTDFGSEPYLIPGSLDIHASRVEVESLKEWLVSRGFQHGFFFPTPVEAPGYLDPTNPRYAPKLAAAVQAWQAVTETGGKTPKTAIAKWLREHAVDFGLTDEDGKVNETGIEEIAKVANWQPSGGAPKTPGSK